MISVIINNNDNTSLEVTLKNLCKTQKNILDKIHIKVLNSTTDIDVSECIKEYSDYIDIETVCDKYDNQWAMYNKVLKDIKTAAKREIK